jgi:kojibiose phosphorylase
LKELDARRLIELHRRFRADLWTVVREGVRPEREDALHAIFSVGNGAIGVRGNISPLRVGGPQETYLAGFYDRLVVPPPDPGKWSPYLRYWSDASLVPEGREVKSCIVSCPDFLDVEWTVDGERVDFATGELKSLVRRLDLRTGVFSAEALWVSPCGKELRLTERRFASLAASDRVHVRYEAEPVGFSGKLRVAAAIDADTKYLTYPAVPGEERLYEVVEMSEIEPAGVAALVRGRHEGMRAAFATGLRIPDRPGAEFSVEKTGRRIAVAAEVPVEDGKILYVERASTFSSDGRSDDPLGSAVAALEEALTTTFGEARAASIRAWDRLWRSSDVVIEGDDRAQLAARFSICNLLMAAPREDSGVSIPVKALTGGGYRGLVYWDTDIYMAPFFNLTQPDLARNLARFHCRTLDAARRKAAAHGFRGAMYPWSTDASGDEQETVWSRNVTHQVHVTADVAYALWQYVDCSGDMEFYVNHAAEVLIETARFWASKAVEREGRLSIPDAGGPDEYHVVSDDSAMVNGMAAYNVELARRAIEHLGEHAPEKLAEVRARTGLTDGEIAAFAEFPSRVLTMQRPDGLFEQCRGFFDLEDRLALDPVADAPHLTQTLRQPDVLMLFYLLPGRWPPDVVRGNWDYYEPRTVHASSLSHPVHGVLAAELGLEGQAQDYLRRSLGMDLDDEMGNARLGAHMATNGMTWVALVRGVGGTWPVEDRIRIEPHLPRDWTRLRFRLKWRGADFTVDVTHEGVEVTNSASAPAALPLDVRGEDHLVGPGETVRVEGFSKACKEGR